MALMNDAWIAAALSASMLGPPPGEQVSLTASMPDEVAVGREFEVSIGVSIPDSWKAAGVPKPLLQIEHPDGVALSGRVIESARDLARNQFIEEPFERQIDFGESSFGVTLTAPPEEGDVLGVNVVTYVAGADDADVYFVRRRVELPLKAGASGTSKGQAKDSGWGRNGTLEIGDRAKAFKLPRADGSTVSLEDYKGERNVIVTTYRAFW